MVSDSNLCPECGYKNRVGVLVCDNCGQPLIKGMSTLTTRIKPSSELPEAFSDEGASGTSHFDQDTSLALYFSDTGQSLILQIPEHITMGRVDLSHSTRPDVDLTEYGAVAKGVSRIHATFLRDDDTLLLNDIRSTNGTYLNDQRLIPDEPQIIRDGDTIQLGKFKICIHFQ